MVKWITCAVTAIALFSLTACNTEIKVDYGYNPSDYVQLGQYKGIEVHVDEVALFCSNLHLQALIHT